MESTEYYALIGVLVVFGGGLLGAVVKFLSNYKKAIEQDVARKNKSADELREVMYEIKDELTRLTSRLDQYIDKLTIQENRVTKHGMEIDDTKKRVTNLETKLGNLEFKVGQYHGDKV